MYITCEGGWGVWVTESLNLYSRVRSSISPYITFMNKLFEKCMRGLLHNQYQIQVCIPACVMSTGFFTITSLYLVRLENLLMDKIALKTLPSNTGKLR